MALAMITCDSLGHTGRDAVRRSDDPCDLYGYCGRGFGAHLRRIRAKPGSILLQIADGAWAVAFFLFAVSHGPLLARTRVKSH